MWFLNESVITRVVKQKIVYNVALLAPSVVQLSMTAQSLWALILLA